MRRVPVLLLSIILLMVGNAALAQDATDETAPDSQFAANPDYPAPDFPEGLDWLNVPAPLHISDLRGKIVILDFWTYGCINCIHMIPTLKQLEAKYPDELVIVGVHSAKFQNEGETQNIRQIVERYGLMHPVINDSDFATWNTYGPYGVNAWPTFVVIDPRGNVLASQAGEIPFDAFDEVISGMLNYFDRVGEINRDPIEITPEGADDPNTALLFPGKVLVDEAGNRLFIADLNHNRIVITDLTTNEVLDVIGAGAPGLNDGDYDEATFSKPQGMAVAGNTLYVADMENNAIRAVDLDAQTVATIAGTGAQGYGIGGSPATEVPLSSPWDVAVQGNTLYIAMAGRHQIWEMTLDDSDVQPYIGSGYEGLLDDSLARSELAQPSGLNLVGDQLYFADSELSSIRVADLSEREVRTLAGPVSNDLFGFGDADGGIGTVRLQHPLGVTTGPDGLLYIADTYNSKIKVIDPATHTTTTLFGLADSGFRDGGADVAQFYEPGGIDYADGKLYVADTNNQAIRVIDLETNEVSTLQFANPEALAIDGEITVAGGNSAAGEQVTLPEQSVAAGDGEIVLQITLPEGYKINEDAPSQAEWSSAGEAVSIDEADHAPSIDTAEVRVPVTLSEGSATVSGDLAIYYCEAVQESLCYIDNVRVEIPVTVSADGDAHEIVVDRAITPPEISVGGL